MTSVLYILDGRNFLYNELELTPAEIQQKATAGELPLPFHGQVGQILTINQMVVIGVHSHPSAAARLTDQQRRVVEHLVKGKTVSQIGLLLHISPETVNFHITNAKQRLNVQTRNELIAQYCKNLAPYRLNE